jgi:membrane fusion protein (multidrug efflux system)
MADKQMPGVDEQAQEEVSPMARGREGQAYEEPLPLEPGDKVNEIPDDTTPAKKKRPLYQRPAVRIVALVLLVVAAIFVIRYWLYARSHESTDNAFIDGHIIQVSPHVSGYVARVYVTDNQMVKQGDLLAELDARDYETKVDQAKAALNAGKAKLKEARSSVNLTQANTRANVQQASAGVNKARAGVQSQSAAAAAERTRISQSAAGIIVAEGNLAQMRSQLQAALAEAARANADVERYQALFAKDEISRQQLDVAIAAARSANAQVEAARARIVAAEAQVAEARAAERNAAENARRAQAEVSGARAGVGEALGRLSQANTGQQQVAVSEAQAETAGASLEELQAAVDQAELELSYTKIYAPEAGRVTRKAVEQGALVQVGTPLLAIVPGDVWVTANFKENQIGNLRPRAPVEIKVDAYPGLVFKGHVDSIQAGTGARFSLIPPENASGNYVKVVQRVPVKIVFDQPPDQNHMLAPGMSVEPEVLIK